MDMNKREKRLFTVGLVSFLILLGMAGACDYREAVISSMSQQAYDAIIEKVGTSERDIVREYINNKSYYDNLP